MTEPQLKQQRLEVQSQSPNRRTKKKQRGADSDEKTEVIEDEMEETGPKVLFTGIGAEVQSLYQKPNDERWRKLPAPTKDKAKAYTMMSRFVPKSEATDGISCHDDFAGTACLYLSCHQIQTSTPTKTASDIQVVQWKQFFVEILSITPENLKTKNSTNLRTSNHSTRFLHETAPNSTHVPVPKPREVIDHDATPETPQP
jgi:hypothetical protein